MLPVRAILHPTDFSECSQAALEVACALANDYRVRLILLHVGVLPTPFVPEGALGLDLDGYEQELRAKLDELTPTERGLYPERRLVMAAEPVEEIVRIAHEEPCDMIVMGTHGRTGLRHLLMGSVAEQVLRRADCPVLTVRTGARGVPHANKVTEAAASR